MQLTVHAIAFRMKDLSWTGEQSILNVKYLAEETHRLYISAENQEDLADAFKTILECPMISDRSIP